MKDEASTNLTKLAAIQTVAQILLSDQQILNERPESMTYMEYKALRRHQTAVLRALTAKAPNSKILSAMGLRPKYNYHGR